MRWVLLGALAPISWGSVYFVTLHWIPAEEPFTAAALRALPAGLLLLVLRRRLPRGAWWWRSAVLGVLNCGAFFVLVYLAAKLLPTSIAAMLMSLSPIAMMLIAWALVAERPTARRLLGAAMGLVGVVLLMAASVGAVDGWGVAPSVTAMAMYALGSVLAKRWSGEVDAIASSSWQLTAGGLLLVPLALAIEGVPGAVPPTALLGYAYIAAIPTTLAFVCWFGALRHLTAGQVGLLGLLNPVTGVLLGVLLGAELLTAWQWLGIAVVLAGIALGQTTARQGTPSRARGLVTRAPSARAPRP
ncbi:probable blue pigment (indigoidine) exporter [Agrococcus carbonis]|uniref:Probable blue pigment (Indigoidine) exporter n=2 Tax=Agrococcus carbonis TaxID=684552 RepID=A0A1H1P0F2_9MICO|nr:probable blue pigment (indigoidine) exporter [Agrococcus carbonis]